MGGMPSTVYYTEVVTLGTGRRPPSLHGLVFWFPPWHKIERSYRARAS